MEVITIESEAYRELAAKIDTISKFVASLSKPDDDSENTGTIWVDSYEVCTFLKISARTLQRLRSQQQITYSRVRGKNYYKIEEIQRLMNEHIIRRGEEHLQDLIKNHKLYAEQRRNIKEDE